MAVAPTSSIRSVNFQDRFIHHAQFLGELTTIESDLDRKDAALSCRASSNQLSE